MTRVRLWVALLLAMTAMITAVKTEVMEKKMSMEGDWGLLPGEEANPVPPPAFAGSEVPRASAHGHPPRRVPSATSSTAAAPQRPKPVHHQVDRALLEQSEKKLRDAETAEQLLVDASQPSLDGAPSEKAEQKHANDVDLPAIDGDAGGEIDGSMNSPDDGPPLGDPESISTEAMDAAENDIALFPQSCHSEPKRKRTVVSSHAEMGPCGKPLPYGQAPNPGMMDADTAEMMYEQDLLNHPPGQQVAMPGDEMPLAQNEFCRPGDPIPLRDVANDPIRESTPMWYYRSPAQRQYHRVAWSAEMNPQAPVLAPGKATDASKASVPGERSQDSSLYPDYEPTMVDATLPPVPKETIESDIPRVNKERNVGETQPYRDPPPLLPWDAYKLQREKGLTRIMNPNYWQYAYYWQHWLQLLAMGPPTAYAPLHMHPHPYHYAPMLPPGAVSFFGYESEPFDIPPYRNHGSLPYDFHPFDMYLYYQQGYNPNDLRPDDFAPYDPFMHNYDRDLMYTKYHPFNIPYYEHPR